MYLKNGKRTTSGNVNLDEIRDFVKIRLVKAISFSELWNLVLVLENPNVPKTFMYTTVSKLYAG